MNRLELSIAARYLRSRRGSRLLSLISIIAIGGVLVEWLPYWAFEVDWPILGKLEGPQAGILYGVILVLIIFFMPGGIVYGLRQLRSKFVLFVPRLPIPELSSAQPPLPESQPTESTQTV